MNGEVRSCGTNVGQCALGTQVCSNGTFGPYRGIVHCLDAKTGSIIVYGPERLKPDTYSASLVLADGKIFITNEDGLTSVSPRVQNSKSPRTPECLTINVDGFEDSAAAFSRDGHWMFFVSDRPGSLGTPGFNGRDIWQSWRSHVHDDQGWGEPFHGGSLINTAFAEAGPSSFENEGGVPQLFFTSNRDGSFDIWVSDVLPSGVVVSPRRVDELNTATLLEPRPSIRHDGLEIFFFRGVGVNDIYAATRPDPGALWSDPVNLGAPVSGPSSDQQPGIASDRETLFFASDRSPGGFGNLDIWVSTREKVK